MVAATKQADKKKMKVSLYINYSDPIQLRKNLTPINQYDCQLKDGCSMEKPTIKLYDLSTNIYRANYMYINDFGRYYYIDDIITTPNWLEIIALKCDVAMSFAGAILNINTYIDRQEYEYNLYISDPQLPVRTERGISYLKIGELGNESNILLTVTGSATEETETNE